MIEDKGLLNIVHRLVVDEDFRQRFTTIPKETLMAELGVSEEVCRTLVALVPVLLAGGLFVLGDGPSPGTNPLNESYTAPWGKW